MDDDIRDESIVDDGEALLDEESPEEEESY
jgi:hypothetical protein